MKISKNKIFSITDRYYPTIGGAEKQAQMMCEGFVEHGVDVEVITLSKVRNDNNIIKKININRIFSRTLKPKGFSSVFTIPTMIVHSFKMVGHDSNVFVRGSFNWALAVTFLTLFKKINFIFIIESGDYRSIINNKFFSLLKLFRIKLIKPNCFIAVSKFIQDDLRKFYPGITTHLIHNSVVEINNNVIQGKSEIVDADSLKFIFLGTVTEQKGLLHLIHFWTLVERKFPSFELNIVGHYDAKNPFFQLLKNEVTSRRLKNIKFHGQKKNVNNLLLHSNIYISLSLTEACPVSFSEAMSYKLPIIYSNIPGHKDFFINTKNELEVDLNDIENSFSKIMPVLDDKDRLNAIGRSLYLNFKSNYSYDKTLAQYYSLLS